MDDANSVRITGLSVPTINTDWGQYDELCEGWWVWDIASFKFELV